MIDVLAIPPWLNRVGPTRLELQARESRAKAREAEAAERRERSETTRRKRRKAPQQVKALRALGWTDYRIGKMTRAEADTIIFRQQEYER